MKTPRIKIRAKSKRKASFTGIVEFKGKIREFGVYHCEDITSNDTALNFAERCLFEAEKAINQILKDVYEPLPKMR